MNEIDKIKEEVSQLQKNMRMLEISMQKGQTEAASLQAKELQSRAFHLIERYNDQLTPFLVFSIVTEQLLNYYKGVGKSDLFLTIISKRYLEPLESRLGDFQNVRAQQILLQASVRMLQQMYNLVYKGLLPKETSQENIELHKMMFLAMLRFTDYRISALEKIAPQDPLVQKSKGVVDVIWEMTSPEDDLQGLSLQIDQCQDCHLFKLIVQYIDSLYHSVQEGDLR